MNYLIYQIKVAGILTGLYLIYVLFLKKSSLFPYRRLFLLAGLVISFILPFIDIRFNSPRLYQYYQLLPEVTVGNVSRETSFDYQSLIVPFLSFVTLLVLFGFIKQLIIIYKLINSSTIYKMKGYKLVSTEGNVAFSFFKYIFLGKNVAQEDADVILAHEQVHAILHHSIDIMLVDIVLLMQWFNPVVWFWRKELKENHEFEADKLLLESGISPDQYQQLLLNQMFQTSGVRFSSFNYNSFIKNRIKMMTTIPRAGKTRFLLATIMSLMVVLMFSFKAERISINPVSIALPDTLKQKANKDVAYLKPEKNATFNGKGLEAFSSYVAENVKYPKEAVKAGIQGKIYVQFVVDVDGQVRDAKVLRGVSLMLDAEAVRVVKSSPVWTPAQDKGVTVKQIFTLPVVFALKDKK